MRGCDEVLEGERRPERPEVEALDINLDDTDRREDQGRGFKEIGDRSGDLAQYALNNGSRQFLTCLC